MHLSPLFSYSSCMDNTPPYLILQAQSTWSIARYVIQADHSNLGWKRVMPYDWLWARQSLIGQTTILFLPVTFFALPWFNEGLSLG